MMLWPQAWPISGSASYSAQMPTTSGPLPKSARNAVSRPPADCGDLESALGDQRLRLGAAAVLGERQFRLGVNRVRQLDQVAATAPHRVLDAYPRGDGGHLRSISPTDDG